jgi:hypothetical protein
MGVDYREEKSDRPPPIQWTTVRIVCAIRRRNRCVAPIPIKRSRFCLLNHLTRMVMQRNIGRLSTSVLSVAINSICLSSTSSDSTGIVACPDRERSGPIDIQIVDGKG